MLYGYWGKILRVNLSKKTIKIDKISQAFCRKYLGGVGFGAYILFNEVEPEIGALDPENRIIFSVGPFQASAVPGSGKFIVVSKSPLTNTIFYSMAGGRMAQMLKKSGYDALVIQGKSEKPVYLFIKNGKVEIKDANKIWGKDTSETVDILKEEIDEPKAAIADIGPSGEKLVAISCIVVDKTSFAGRGGLGAVMGSKKLKAIAVKGNLNPKVADLEKIRELARKLNKQIKTNAPEALLKGGTTASPKPAEESGDLPIKYWKGDSGGIWTKQAEKLSYPFYSKVLNVDLSECAKIACLNCPIHCHRFIDTSKRKKYAAIGGGPEYEALGMLGSCNLVEDIHAIAKANQICNLYGIDCISAGSFVAFATECYEKGLLSQADCYGMTLKWGDGDQLVEIIQQIAESEKLGRLFADGIVKAAEKIGKDAPKIAVHVKGLDLPAHDPRAYFSLAVSYATNSAGANHSHGLCYKAPGGLLLPEMGINIKPDRFDIKDKHFIAAKFQDLSALHDAATQCNFMLFGGFKITEMLEVLNTITGWKMSIEEFLEIGERISTLKRAINVKWGFSRKDDQLPEMAFMASKKGSRAGKIPMPFEPVLDAYYKLRGWDKNGKPTIETMKRLGLG